MALSPADLERVNLETVNRDAEIYERGVKQVLEDGWVVWQIGPPGKRLAGYFGCTWPEDLQLVLTEDYIALFHAGILPPLRAMTEWARITAPEDDGKGGQVIPQPSDFKPYFWALLAICPPFVFEHYAKDFRSLWKSAYERQVAGE